MEKEEYSMRKGKNSFVTSLLVYFGVVLIIGSVSLMLYQSVRQKITVQSNAEIVDTLFTLMPSVHSGEKDDRVDMNMPMLEIYGENFVGIIEIPLFNRKLPVCGSWNRHKVSEFPCRYSGSLYDGSLIIGGSDAAGQFDFTKNISVGDSVFLTDMVGGQYFYRVEWIKTTADVSTEKLVSDKADLILFARNTYSLDYTVIQCSVQIH